VAVKRRRGARIGIFGGTFDPPHVGHLAIAEWARDRLKLDRVLFVPAGQPPHKRRPTMSSPEERLAMTRLAVRGHPAFRVSTLEVGSNGPSFTANTIRRLIRARPTDRLYLLIGGDSLDDFRTWRDYEDILAHATLAVADRPGAGRDGARAWAKRRGAVWVGNPGLDISSSMVRDLARSGRSVRYLVPDAVARHIERRRLYRGGRR
jgi:nicotinate-nucleotide adenylyltransferase